MWARKRREAGHGVVVLDGFFNFGKLFAAFKHATGIKSARIVGKTIEAELPTLPEDARNPETVFGKAWNTLVDGYEMLDAKIDLGGGKAVINLPVTATRIHA